MGREKRKSKRSNTRRPGPFERRPDEPTPAQQIFLRAQMANSVRYLPHVTQRLSVVTAPFQTITLVPVEPDTQRDILPPMLDNPTTSQILPPIHDVIAAPNQDQFKFANQFGPDGINLLEAMRPASFSALVALLRSNANLIPIAFAIATYTNNVRAMNFIKTSFRDCTNPCASMR